MMAWANRESPRPRRSVRLEQIKPQELPLRRRSPRFEQHEEHESDGDPDFNHKDFEWLYSLPPKHQPKTFVSEGLAARERSSSRRRFHLPLPKQVGHRNKARQDFRLPPNIYAPLYPLQSVNGWKTLQKNAWTRDASQIYEKIREHCPMCICIDDCDEDCLNRASKIECDASCCPLPTCTNRAFQVQSKLPPPFIPSAENPKYKGGRLLYSRGYEVFATGPKGFGLRATREYEPHELVLEYTGEVITNDEMAHRMSTVYANTRKYYCLSFVNGLVIDSGRKGSEARFVNHSCAPNCEMQKWYVKGTPRIGLFAGEEPISAGSELTYDYNFDIFKGAIGQRCYCGESKCRGIIGKRYTKEVREPIKLRISLKKVNAAPPRAPQRRSTRRRTTTATTMSVITKAASSIPTPPIEEAPISVDRRAERAALRATKVPITAKNLPRMRRSFQRKKRTQLKVSSLVIPPVKPLSPDCSISSDYNTCEDDVDMPSSHTSAQESDDELMHSGEARNHKDAMDNKKDDGDDEESVNEIDHNAGDDNTAEQGGANAGEGSDSDDQNMSGGDEIDDDDEEDSDLESNSEEEHDEADNEADDYYPSKRSRNLKRRNPAQRNYNAQEAMNGEQRRGKGRPRLSEEEKIANALRRDEEKKLSPPVRARPVFNDRDRAMRHRRRTGDDEEFSELGPYKRVRRRRNGGGDEDYEDPQPVSEIERQQYLEDNVELADKLKTKLLATDSENEVTAVPASHIPQPVLPIAAESAPNGPTTSDENEDNSSVSALDDEDSADDMNTTRSLPVGHLSFNRTNYVDRHVSLGNRLKEAVTGEKQEVKPEIISSVASTAVTGHSPIPTTPNGSRSRSVPVSSGPQHTMIAPMPSSMQIPIQAMTTVPARITPAIPTQTRRHPTSPRNSQRMEVRLPANNHTPSVVPPMPYQSHHSVSPAPQPQQPMMPIGQPAQAPHMQVPYMFMNPFQMGGQMMMPQMAAGGYNQISHMQQQQQIAMQQSPGGPVMIVQQPMMMQMPGGQFQAMQIPQFMSQPQQLMYTAGVTQQPHHTMMYPQAMAPHPQMAVHAQNPSAYQPNNQYPIVLPQGQQVVFQSQPQPQPGNSSQSQTPVAQHQMSFHTQQEQQPPLAQQTTTQGSSAQTTLQPPTVAAQGENLQSASENDVPKSVTANTASHPEKQHEGFTAITNQSNASGIPSSHPAAPTAPSQPGQSAVAQPSIGQTTAQTSMVQTPAVPPAHSVLEAATETTAAQGDNKDERQFPEPSTSTAPENQTTRSSSATLLAHNGVPGPLATNDSAQTVGGAPAAEPEPEAVPVPTQAQAGVPSGARPVRLIPQSLNELRQQLLTPNTTPQPQHQQPS